MTVYPTSSLPFAIPETYDILRGGAGNDTINARESVRTDGDEVYCGPGRDVVLTDSTTEDIIAANCESVREG